MANSGKEVIYNGIPDVAGEAVYREYVGGAATVHTEGGAGVGQSFNREASAAQITTLASGIIKFTWPAGSRPTEIEVKLIAGGGWAAFDVPDAATATAWLNGASGEAVDSQRYLIPEYLPEETAAAGASERGWIQPFTDGLSNMYIKSYLTTPTAVIVEGS